VLAVGEMWLMSTTSGQDIYGYLAKAELFLMFTTVDFHRHYLINILLKLDYQTDNKDTA